MRALAGFVMRGRLPAALAVLVCLLLPPLVWLSGPIIALVTLRRGISEGALVTGIAAATMAAMAYASGMSGAVVTPLAYLWLPLLAAAAVLRITVSLARTLQVIAAAAALAVVVFHVAVADPAAFWDTRLDLLRDLVGWPALSGSRWQGFKAAVTPVMTGLVFVNEAMLIGGSLLLARWWQALLYNPGGFRREFYALDLGQALAAAAAAGLLAGVLVGPGLGYDIGLVLSSVFGLQALAVVHAVAAARSWPVIALVGVYVVAPLVFRLVAIAGIVDAFVNFRRRYAVPPEG